MLRVAGLRLPAWFLGVLLVFAGFVVPACSERSSGVVRSAGGTSSEPVEVATRLAASDKRLSARLSPREKGEGFEPDSVQELGYVSPGWRATRDRDFSALSARVPREADGALRIGVGRLPNLQLKVTPIGARAGVFAEAHEGRLVYRGAYEDCDVVWGGARSSIEEALVLRSEGAPHAFGWRVDLPVDVAHVEHRHSGLWFLDAKRELVLHLAEPYVLDVDGGRHEARLTWRAEARELWITVPQLHASKYPLLLDPAYETEVWVEQKEPPKVDHALMAYDETRQRVVLVGSVGDNMRAFTWDGYAWRSREPARGEALPSSRGGATLTWDPTSERVLLFGGRSNNYKPLADTWLWDGIHWTLADAAPAAMKPRLSHTMTWDATRKRLVLFGGTDFAQQFNDTWLWDGTRWTAAGAPPAALFPRFGHSATWDAARQRIVVFAGRNGPSLYKDTWLWDGAAWTQGASAPVSSAGRYAHAAAWDGTRQQVVSFGGVTENGDAVGDTLLWNGTSWASVIDANGPSARYGTSLTWDGAKNAVALFGGRAGSDNFNDTWLWNGASWTPGPIAPPRLEARNDPRVVFDAGRKQLLLYGGGGTVQLNDTWIWDGPNWREASFSPPQLTARIYHTMTWDPSRRRALLFGGLSQQGILGDTWLWDGSSWNQYVGPGPSLRAQAFSIWDAAREQIVLFGGYGGTTLNDTWLWNGQSWSQGPAAPPALVPRGGLALAWDDVRKRVVLYGGYGTAPLNDTWLWDGQTWQSGPTPPAGMLGRSGHSLTWDAARERIVLFGGSGDQGALNDTWLWDGSAWSAGPSAPVGLAARSGHIATWDDRRKNIVLFGGGGAQGALNDTWLWDGSAWKPTAPPPPLLTARAATGATWDSGRGRVTLFGGFADASLGDTWTWDGSAWKLALDANSEGPAGRSQHTLTYASGLGRHLLFGGSRPGTFALSETWTLYMRGGGCSSGAECGSGFCTDGVCCETPSCGTCQTCAGESPGTCSKVILEEDPDSCSAKERKSCNRQGECVPGLGASCTSSAECASGICSSGICCDTACDGACQTCKGAEKIQGDDGRCGTAKVGTNPGGRCAGAATCSAEATCVSTEVTGASCREGRYSLSPDKTVTTDCAPYKCTSGTCGKSCATAADCIFPATCSPEGVCSAPLVVVDDGSGCSCRVGPAAREGRSSRFGPLAAVSTLLLLLARRRGRGRAPSSGAA